MTSVVLDTEAFFGLVHGPDEIFAVGTVDPARWSHVRSAKAGAERALMLDKAGAKGVHWSTACLLDIPVGGARGGSELVRGFRVAWADLDLGLVPFHPRSSDSLTDEERTMALAAFASRTGRKVEDIPESEAEAALLKEANAPERLSEEEIDEGIAFLLSALDRCISAGLCPSPSLVVRSGQGLQSLWVLDVLYDGERNIWLVRETCEGIARRLYDAGADPQVTEITRCLRVPGTTHRKISGRPLPCTVIRANDTRYSLESLARAVGVDPDGTIKRTPGSNGSLPIERLLAVASGVETAPDGMGHKVLLDIARELRNDGADEATICEALAHVKTGTPKSEEEQKNVLKWAMQLEKGRGTGKVAHAVSTLLGRTVVSIRSTFDLAREAALQLIKECEESGTKIDPLTLKDHPQGSKMMALLEDLESSEREIILRTVAKAGIGLRLAKDVQAILRTFSNRTVSAIIAASFDTPYPFLAECEVPEGWSVRRDGGIARTSKDIVVLACGEPILPIKVLTDTETGEERLRCTSRNRGEWREAEAPRANWIDGKSLVQLANKGVPVLGSATTHLADWIEAFCRRNHDRIPKGVSLGHCGWADDKFAVFSFGSKCIGAEIDGRTADGELAAALHPSGTLDEWRKCCELWIDSAAPSIAFAASILSPFLHPLHVGAFVLTLGGETSQGKTTTLQIAASAWGYPGEAEGRGLIMGLDMTRLAASAFAAWLRHLPVFFDEGQRFDKVNRNEVEEIIYSLANGQPRARCRRDGSPIPSPTWCSVSVLSGERDWAGDAKHGGFMARSLALPWPPFPPGSGDRVKRIKKIVAENHGHVGPELITRAMTEGVPIFCRRLLARANAITSEWLTVEGTPMISQRTARLWALIAAIGEEASAIGLVPGDWPILKYVKEAWGNAGIQEIVAGDPSYEALRSLLDLPGRFPSAFLRRIGARNVESKQPGLERMGRVDFEIGRVPSDDDPEMDPDIRECTSVSISISAAKKVLIENGYDPRFCLALWERKGLLTAVKGNRTPLVRVGEQVLRCLVFQGSTLRERGLI